MIEQPHLIQVSTGTRSTIDRDTIIGRGPSCDVQLPAESKASREHAKVGLSAKGLWVEDLRSTNGTFVNNARITARRELCSGDRLRFDVEEFEVHIPAAAVANDKTVMRRDDPVSVSSNASEKMIPDIWIGRDPAKGSKTQFVDPEELKRILEGAKSGVRQPALDDPHLEVLTGSRAGVLIRLVVSSGSNNEWTIGNQEDSNIQFFDSGVSAVHAKMVNQNGRWKVIDRLSANGTFVNGKRTNLSFLSSTDRLRFGPVECVFHGPGELAQRPSGRESQESKSRSNAWLLAAVAFVATLIALAVIAKFWLGA
jgi:pSer/pThr/pTyr-binding forkhead associated (FHA) protein